MAISVHDDWFYGYSFPVHGKVIVDDKRNLLYINDSGSLCAIDTLLEPEPELPHDNILFHLVYISVMDMVKLQVGIFSVSQSTFPQLLKNVTAWVMIRVSYKSHSV